jgi:hypothetical protein
MWLKRTLNWWHEHERMPAKTTRPRTHTLEQMVPQAFRQTDLAAYRLPSMSGFQSASVLLRGARKRSKA